MTALMPRMPAAGSVASEARRIARDIAMPAAQAVDAERRLPLEAIAALWEAGLLGAAVPRSHGGLGAGIADIAGACFELGQGCSSAAMVFAMHQIQVACLCRHAGDEPWQSMFLRRVADEGLLLASGTTEGATGGDVRRSDCAMLADDGSVRVEKAGCVISYGAAADAVLITARRDPEAPSNDQVLLVAERSQLDLEQKDTWDTLGMRGTDSRGYRLRAICRPGQIMPAPYAVISAETMLPVSHIVWASLWLGIATDACNRARRAVRDRARKAPGRTPAGAGRLAETLVMMQSARATLIEAVHRYEAALAEPERLGSISFGLAMNSLKAAASTASIQIVSQAMQAIGLAGYRNDTPYSVARHLRDVHSSVLMIGNDRILANNANMVAAYRGEEPLFA